MGTWVAAIVETQGRPDFWDVARRHGVAPSTSSVPGHVLIDCGADYESSFRLAQNLSRDLGTMAIGFAIQTSADVHVANAYARGECVRRLEYNRDDGGWVAVEGVAQAWERAYFFDDDMLGDELSDEDIARYEVARRAGDASSALDLLHPSSTLPMCRVCGVFQVAPDSPAAHWKKPSLLSRLFRSSMS